MDCWKKKRKTRKDDIKRGVGGGRIKSQRKKGSKIERNRNKDNHRKERGWENIEKTQERGKNSNKERRENKTIE